jgi:hypothetical protein
MKKCATLPAALMLVLSSPAFADAIAGDSEKDPLNLIAIGMFALLAGATFMAFAVLEHFSFSFGAPFKEATENHPNGVKIMAPGSLISAPISAISLGVGLMFGTAGLPHILMRFFTVAGAQAARKSVFYATGFIGYFYILTFIIGFGAITLVATDGEFLDPALLAAGKNVIEATKGGTNMVAVDLAKAVGGDIFFGFISAVAFATILAVVSGLTLAGASAISHDLYATVVKKRKASERHEILVSKLATVFAWGPRHRTGHRGREAQRRFRRGSRLCGRGVVQFPGARRVDILARHDDAGRVDRRLPRFGRRSDGRGAFAGHLGRRLRIPEGIGSGSIRQPDLILGGHRFFRRLDGLEARSKRTRQNRSRGFRCSIHAFSNWRRRRMATYH